MSLHFYPQCWTSLCHLFKFMGHKDLKLYPCPSEKFRYQGQYYLTLSPYNAVMLTYNFYENPFLRPWDALTDNVDIFALQNFCASSPQEHFRVFLIFVHLPVSSICFIMIIIFTHIKFSRT